MKTLNLYIAKTLFLSTALAVGVLTFVLLSAHLVKAFELIARGIPLRVLAQFLLYRVPDMLTFAIPMALLCATVIVFSRMSADNEIIAMKAGGVSLWQIIASGLLLGIVLSGICFWLHTKVAPVCRFRADQLTREELMKSPMAAIEPGRFLAMPGYEVCVGKQDGDTVEDVHIVVLAEAGKIQDITARRGRIRLNEAGRQLELTLEDATVASLDLRQSAAERGWTRHTMEQVRFPLDYGTALDRKPLRRKLGHMDMATILRWIVVFKRHDWEERITAHYVELNTRMSMALSPFAFLLLGIPFGIRTRRPEASVGVLLSLLLAMGFYAFIMLADALKYKSGLHPELLVWLPNIVYQAGGLWTLSVLARR